MSEPTAEKAHTSDDGRMRSSDPSAVALWDSIGNRMANDKRTWTDILRSLGVKYAHPDDGWVNRDRNTHTRSWYPQFDDRPEVGDLIAFGSPPGGEHYRSWHDVWRGRKDRYAREQMDRLEGKPESSADGYRICRVTEVERRHGILGYHQSFAYEDTDERLPPRKPTRWQRIKRRLRLVIPPATKTSPAEPVGGPPSEEVSRGTVVAPSAGEHVVPPGEGR